VWVITATNDFITAWVQVITAMNDFITVLVQVITGTATKRHYKVSQ
jgi:hypothetical protein